MLRTAPAAANVNAPTDWRESVEPFRLMPVFAGLGPVLLVRGSQGDFHPGWRVRQSIDSFGVREYLECGALRLHRLPDSDYLGWERVARAAVAHDAGLRREAPHAERLACTVRVLGARIDPVTRLSGIGWQVVQQLLQLEHARLVDVDELR